jgi:dihydropteroate synthase
VVRVHDVREMIEVVRVADAIRGEAQTPGRAA